MRLPVLTSMLVACAFASPASAATCEELGKLAPAHATVTLAQQVAAGAFVPPGAAPAPAQAQIYAGLPAFCRVALTLTPSSDSDIKVEVWLPLADWNGKFQAVGNGGWAGVISYPALAAAIANGYATASTNTGHEGGNALFAIDHPEKLVDFAYRAVHEMTVQAKALINAHYGRAPRLSYWNGCSTGGRQGLMSAQKYPDDFDAIIAGAPASYQTHLHTWDLSVSVPVLKDKASAVPAAKLTMVTRAVVNACDAKDGVTDGLLTNPQACSFDLASLQCKAGDAESCLTAPQVAAMKRVYQPAHASGGKVVFPGKTFGSESQWTPYVGGQQAPGVSIGSFQVAYNNAKWDPLTFELDRDLKLVEEKVGAIVDAVNPDLRAFKARGGKILMYHGWNDTAISPGNSIDYLTSVQKKMGGTQDDFIRLFMAPGMNHCAGGVGPSQANWMAVLERWRENGSAPDRITAYRVTNDRVDMTRPLCPHPQVAVYKGSGSTNDADNFVCKAN